MGTHEMTDRPPRPDGGWQAVLERSCVSVRASTVKHNRKIDATIPGRPAPPHPPRQGYWVEEAKLPLAFQTPFPGTLLWLPYVLAHSVFNWNQMKRQLRSAQHPLFCPSENDNLAPGSVYLHCSQRPAAGQCPIAEHRVPAFHAANRSHGSHPPSSWGQRWVLPPWHFGLFSVILSIGSHYVLDAGLFFIMPLLFCVYLLN